MLRSSRLTDYAIVLLAHFIRRGPDVWLSAAEIAEAAQIPAATTAKLVKRLARENLLRSRRGASGGYALAEHASSISVADVVDAIEGKIQLTTCCTSTTDECDFKHTCIMAPVWPELNQAVRDVLSGFHIKTLIERDCDSVSLNPSDFGK